MNYLDDLLPLFVAEDDLRPALKSPNKIKNFVYASNGHIAIKISANQLKKEYKNDPDFPKILEVFNNRNRQTPRGVEIGKIKRALSGLERENVYYSKTVDCGDCNSSGECFECGQECPKCDGEGSVTVENKEEVVGTQYSHYDLVRLGKNAFDPGYIELLIKAAEKIKGPILINGNVFMKPCFFSIDKTNIVLMPKDPGLDDEYGKMVTIEI